MAAQKNSRLLAGNWSPGKVTLLNALGLGRWNLNYPKFQPGFTKGVVAAADAHPTAVTSPATGGGGGSTSAPATGATGGQKNTTVSRAPQPVANGSKRAWIVAMLGSLGAPATAANINSVGRWIDKEQGGQWPPSASFNPLNTTLKMPGSSNFNNLGGGTGVQNFTSQGQGLSATVQTLNGHQYTSIVSALRSGRGVCGGGFAAEFLTWSGSGYSSVC